jgi:hypothetical protein
MKDLDLNLVVTYIPCLHKEFEEYSPSDIKDWYSTVVDRWTWDTGSEEDKQLLQKLSEEVAFRKSHDTHHCQITTDTAAISISAPPSVIGQTVANTLRVRIPDKVKVTKNEPC